MASEDKYGMTALLWAVKYGQGDAFKKLFEAGANISGANKQGLNVLHLAVMNDDYDILHKIFLIWTGLRKTLMMMNKRKQHFYLHLENFSTMSPIHCISIYPNLMYPNLVNYLYHLVQLMSTP